MEDQVKLNLRIAHYLFLALLAGQVLMVMFAWYIAGSRSVFFNQEAAGGVLFQLLPIVSVGTALLALFIGNKRKKNIAALKSPVAKVHHFRDTALMQAALMEGSNLFAIMVAIFTFSFLPYAFFGFGLVLFLWFYPSERRFRREYLENS